MNYDRKGASKRVKLVGLAALVSISVFAIRVLEIIQIGNLTEFSLLLLAYAIVTYLGLFIAFEFKAVARSYLIVMPQSVLFIVSQVAFVFVFFERDFERVYEFGVLAIILFMIFMGSYVSFLMANVFNVSNFKQIPLVQVAKTTSFFLSLLATFFVTFVFLAVQINVLITVVGLLISYVLISFFHTYHQSLSIAEKYYNIGLITVSVFGFALPAVFLGVRYELSALLPTAAMFVMLSLEMNHYKDRKFLQYLQYAVVIAFAIGINIIFQ